MKKVIFTSAIFYYILLAYLLSLLIFNAYISVTQNRVFGLIPVAIQTVLLYMILTRNKYVKQAIIIWAPIFVIIGPGMIILGNSLYLLSNNPDRFKAGVVVGNLLILISGVIVLVYARKTIIISKFERDLNRDEIQTDGF